MVMVMVMKKCLDRNCVFSSSFARTPKIRGGGEAADTVLPKIKGGGKAADTVLPKIKGGGEAADFVLAIVSPRSYVCSIILHDSYLCAYPLPTVSLYWGG